MFRMFLIWFLSRLNFVFRYVFVCALPGKAIPEVTCTVLDGMVNPTHSLISSEREYAISYECQRPIRW